MTMAIILLAAGVSTFLIWTVTRTSSQRMTDRKQEAAYVATTIAAFLDGPSGEWDWDDFTSCPLRDRKLDNIRRQALAVDLPLDDAGEALLNRLRLEAQQEVQ